MILRALPPPPPETPTKQVFAALKGDAAKWGVSDFSQHHGAALKQALESEQPFDTGWYSVTKEIQSARVMRLRRRGPVHIEVSASMDEVADLVDTALWKAAGGSQAASSGGEVLRQLGLDDGSARRVLDELVAESGQAEDNVENATAELHWRTGFDRLCATLDSLMVGVEAELEGQFEALVQLCGRRLRQLGRRRR